MKSEHNPFAARLDKFISDGGYRKMAASVLILSLEELTCDPSKGRSAPEREEMARLKAEARPWFFSQAFEAFALAFAPAQTIATFREQCLSRPDEIREYLQNWQASHERDRHHNMDSSSWTNGMPANCFPFLMPSLADSAGAQAEYLPAHAPSAGHLGGMAA
jgi:hypothetical protein